MATKMMLQFVLEGSISVHDMEVDHRPYHRNCSCAMHKAKGSCCPQQSNVSFPMKQPPSPRWLSIMEQRRLESTFMQSRQTERTQHSTAQLGEKRESMEPKHVISA